MSDKGPSDIDKTTNMRRAKDSAAPLVEIDLGERAGASGHAILCLHAGIEISHGSEVVCTIRPRENFRPERLAVLATCASSFDIVDLRVVYCSVFANDDSARAGVPAARYATAYDLRPHPRAWVSGPHRAVVADAKLLGQPIISRTCPAEADIAITARHREDSPPSDFEIILWGSVLSESEGHRIYLQEQQALEQAWRCRG